MIENKNARRVFFLGDTHFGVRNSSNEWIDIMRDYFYDWFIPTVKKNYQPGDILIHLGDVYDSRQSINIKVLNLGVGGPEWHSFLATRQTRNGGKIRHRGFYPLHVLAWKFEQRGEKLFLLL